MSKETSYKKEPHVYAEVIHAWADGQDIEYRINGLNDEWCTSNINSGDVLSWSTKCEYRVKPKPPKPSAPPAPPPARLSFLEGLELQQRSTP